MGFWDFLNPFNWGRPEQPNTADMILARQQAAHQRALANRSMLPYGPPSPQSLTSFNTDFSNMGGSNMQQLLGLFDQVNCMSGQVEQAQRCRRQMAMAQGMNPAMV